MDFSPDVLLLLPIHDRIGNAQQFVDCNFSPGLNDDQTDADSHRKRFLEEGIL